MAILRRAPRTPAMPAEVRASLGGVEVLAWAPLRGGGAVAASRDALHIARASEAEPRHVPWELLDHAEWHEPGELEIRAIDGTLAVLALDGEHERLPVVLRERVQASVAHLVQRELPGGITVRAAIRRAADGTLSSQVSYVGVATPTPQVLQVGEELERQARDAVGLPS